MIGQKMMMKTALVKKPPKTILLVLDDNPQIVRMIKRRMVSYFDEVLVSVTPGEASKILEDEAVTHLLCDYNLDAEEGLADMNGYQCIERWRRRFPKIKRAVVFSGSDLSQAQKPVEVDAVVFKPDGIKAVVSALLGPEWRDREKRKKIKI